MGNVTCKHEGKWNGVDRALYVSSAEHRPLMSSEMRLSIHSLRVHRVPHHSVFEHHLYSDSFGYLSTTLRRPNLPRSRQIDHFPTQRTTRRHTPRRSRLPPGNLSIPLVLVDLLIQHFQGCGNPAARASPPALLTPMMQNFMCRGAMKPLRRP